MTGALSPRCSREWVASAGHPSVTLMLSLLGPLSNRSLPRERSILQRACRALASRLRSAVRALAIGAPSAATSSMGASPAGARARGGGRCEESVPGLVQLGLACLLGNGLVGMIARELASLESPRGAGVRREVPERSAFAPPCTPLEGPPGTGTLARIPGVGAWRGEAVAEALWRREDWGASVVKAADRGAADAAASHLLAPELAAPEPGGLGRGGEASLAGLERVSGIGAVTAARLAAAQGHLRRVVHWRPETWP